MIVQVCEIVKDESPRVTEVDGPNRNIISNRNVVDIQAGLFPDDKGEPISVRELSATDSYDIEVAGILTPSYRTVVRITEQEDGSIGILFENIQVRIFPDGIPHVGVAVTPKSRP